MIQKHKPLFDCNISIRPYTMLEFSEGSTGFSILIFISVSRDPSLERALPTYTKESNILTYVPWTKMLDKTILTGFGLK